MGFLLSITCQCFAVIRLSYGTFSLGFFNILTIVVGSILPASTILRSQRSEERRMPSVAGREFEAAKEGCFGLALRDYGWQAMSFHYVYILRSMPHPEQTYVGLTDDLKARLAKHNEGGSPHTSKFRPWEIETAVAFTSREKAAAFEAYLKTGSGHEFRRRHF